MTILVDGRFPFAPVVPTINNAPPVLRAPRLKTPANQRNRRERREKLTIDNGQLTIIGATNIVHLYPSGKVCRETAQDSSKKPSPPGKGNRPQAVDEVRYGVVHCRNNRRRGRQTESHCRERPMCRSGALQLKPLWTKWNHPSPCHSERTQ